MNITEVIEGDEFFQAKVSVLNENYSEDKDIKALSRSVLNQFNKYSKLNKKVAPEVSNSLSQVTEPDKLADSIASHLTLEIKDKQKILECIELSKRIELIYSYMESEMDVLRKALPRALAAAR